MPRTLALPVECRSVAGTPRPLSALSVRSPRSQHATCSISPPLLFFSDAEHPSLLFRLWLALPCEVHAHIHATYTYARTCTRTCTRTHMHQHTRARPGTYLV
mmetsp:Transcript_7485/g.16503  ORF Transcript_7485/g.16503 Transcript_7485/m.16503 type:complete len:102 (+) Transcript_7485:138-443(+)